MSEWSVDVSELKNGAGYTKTYTVKAETESTAMELAINQAKKGRPHNHHEFDYTVKSIKRR